jgi:2-amino-4-hydroxy-6-hydroxymethyldihydropteridine diphosphokinase
MTKIYCSLGSNMGDRLNNLARGVECLTHEKIKVVAQSSIYETSPWGVDSQDMYLNQVIGIETNISPEDLIKIIQNCERKLGRNSKQGHMQARVLDIDIIFYGDQIISTPNIELPHPRMHQRMFVLIPLLELDEDFVHPVMGKAVWELYNECRDESEVILYGVE